MTAGRRSGIGPAEANRNYFIIQGLTPGGPPAAPRRLTKSKCCDTFFYDCDTGGALMPISLRIPPKKEELINRAAKKAGKTKTGFILDAVDEKLRLVENREQTIRKAAGWIGPKEASQLRDDLMIFETMDEADWQ
jgi:hypothetical protein